MRIAWGFADDYLKWRNDPSTRQWGRVGAEITEAGHEEWLIDNQSRLFSMTAIEELGTAYLKLNKERTEGEFSIVVAPDQRGKGAGEKLLKELIDAAFRSTIKRIYGQTREDNPALKVFLKVGFKEFKKEKEWVWIEVLKCPGTQDSKT